MSAAPEACSPGSSRRQRFRQGRSRARPTRRRQGTVYAMSSPKRCNRWSYRRVAPTSSVQLPATRAARQLGSGPGNYQHNHIHPTMGPHSTVRVHRPNPDLQRAPRGHSPIRIRRTRQLSSTAPVPKPLVTDLHRVLERYRRGQDCGGRGRASMRPQRARSATLKRRRPGGRPVGDTARSRSAFGSGHQKNATQSLAAVSFIGQVGHGAAGLMGR